MAQTIKAATLFLPERGKYRDAEFSDREIEGLMGYFKLSRYDDLRQVLAGLKSGRLANAN